MTTNQALLGYYGNPMTDKEEFTKKWMTLYVFPDWMQPIFPPYQHQKVRKQWVHRDFSGPFERVFKTLLDTGLYKELKTFDGIWNIRNMRGLNTPSVHSWGLAVDFNAKENPLGGKVRFSQAFLDVWRKEGFTSGADFGGSRVDGMHFEYTLPARQWAAKQEVPKAPAPKPKPTPKPTTKTPTKK